MPSFANMRTYGKNYKEHPSTVTRPTRADYKNREATEWDVRLDIINGLTSSKILEHAVAFKDKIKFCIIGAEEKPDDRIVVPGNKKPSQGSDEVHVHVAIILEKPAKRGDVLQMLRGPRCIGINNEYAVPRNPKYTYAGWIAHHTKILSKLNPDGPLKLYEYGDLPMDSYDEETCWKVIRMIKKFGNEEMKQRFKSYSTKADEYKEIKIKEELDTIPPLVEIVHDSMHVRKLPESFVKML
uniref:Replication-associated protein n=1 Tax=Tragopan caboti CRESS-DNA-virus sp. TaxID=2815061 RepID=A0A8A4XBR1_9VIRU|nr:MAG: replication-associated protein [Tragopan caboti CRESS-DNA-virus sp.]